ncbi:5'-3'-deoxyribonucleotidase [Virgibacillus siamensis]|uniref:5'-3'-deoxyribonucleotidase n=1 Tax=Virgibacillus siamensis TaxID=480071 RepID=A0ABP3RH06_9BACI
MKRIAIDMDEVIADALPKHVTRFNQLHNDNIKIEDLNGIKLEDLRPEFQVEMKNILLEPTFFQDLAVMEDSQEVIKELNEHFEIFITTAAMEFPTSFTAKYEWLKEHFSFLNDMNFVFCGDKGILNADYLIDDNVHHFKRFSGKGILFSSPQNSNETGYDRVENWQEVRNYFIN